MSHVHEWEIQRVCETCGAREAAPVDELRKALAVARHFDEDAFACDFGGEAAINLPNLDVVISLRDEGETA